MTELTDDAKKLTEHNPDGSIKVAGFVPLQDWGQLGISDLARMCGATWFDDAGKPQFGTDPAWASAMRVAEAAGGLLRLRQAEQVLRRVQRRASSRPRTRSRPARWP